MEWKFIRAQVLEYVGDLPAARKSFQEILQAEPYSARALQVRNGILCGYHCFVLVCMPGRDWPR